MPSSRRCVFGCVTTGLTVHRFPNPAKFPDRFRTWVELGGEQLKKLSVEDIYPRKFVCDKHFLENHRNRNNRLNALAIPTLHLPESHPEPNVCEVSERALTEITNISIDKHIQSQDQGVSTEAMHAELKSLQIPSSSQQLLSGLHVGQGTCLEDMEGSAKQSVPGQNNYPSLLCLSDAATGVKNDHEYCARNIKKPPTTIQNRGKPSMAKKMQGSRKKALSYPVMDAEKKIRNLRREIVRLRKRCKLFKSRLDAAIKSRYKAKSCNFVFCDRLYLRIG